MSYGRAQDHLNGLLCLLIAVEYDLRVLIEGGDSYFSTIPKRKKKWKESFTDNYLQYFQTVCIFLNTRRHLPLLCIIIAPPLWADHLLDLHPVACLGTYHLQRVNAIFIAALSKFILPSRSEAQQRSK